MDVYTVNIKTLHHLLFYDLCFSIQEEATACQQINKKDVKLDLSGTNRSMDVKIENFDIAFGEK